MVEGFPSKIIPFAEDGCGNFAYIEPVTGSVYFWDHEVEGDQKIAPNVGDFISRLAPFDAASVQLEPNQVRLAWIDPSFRASLKKDGQA